MHAKGYEHATRKPDVVQQHDVRYQASAARQATEDVQCMRLRARRSVDMEAFVCAPARIGLRDSRRRAREPLHRPRYRLRHFVRASTKAQFPDAAADAKTEDSFAPATNWDSKTLLESSRTSAEPFDWWHQWYPVALECDLDPSVPTPVTILSQHLVVWWYSPRGEASSRESDAKKAGRPANREDGAWVVFQDSCPHRRAALSEGRINADTGLLQCGYHGWEFSGGGSCEFIPQAADNGVAASSPLACAVSLPTQTISGVVFVWLGSKRPPRSDENSPAVLEGARAQHVVSSITRDVPFSFLTLLQNVLDPAHIHFAHHGQIGHRDRAAPVPIRMLECASDDSEGGPLSGGVTQSGTAFVADYYHGRVQVRFRPPCMVEIQTASGECYAYYSIPVDALRARTIGIQTRARRRPLLWPMIPRWLDHMRRNALVDGDLMLMRSQERELARMQDSETACPTESWRFYMPTSADRLIVELRKWVRRNPPPFLQADSMSDARELQGPLNREQLLDRYESHVRHCSSCRQALRMTEALKFAASISRAVLGVSAVVLGYFATQINVGSTISATRVMTIALLKRSSIACLVLALLCAAMAKLLAKLQKRFYYIETARAHTHAN